MSEKTAGLPIGWINAPINSLIELAPKGTHSDDLDVGFVPMPLMGTKYGEQIAFESRKWNEVKKGYTHFQDGDVLLAKITPCFENGKGGIARGLPSGVGAGSTEYFVCRPDVDRIVPEVLHAFFKTPEFMTEGETQMTGSVGHKRVPKDYLLNSQIPLAPLAEQKRIADKLEVLLGRVDACRSRLDRLPALLKRFRQAILAAATSGKLTQEWREIILGKQGSRPIPSTFSNDQIEPPLSSMPLGWDLQRGADVVEAGAQIIYGIIQPGTKLDEGVPYVRGTDIQDGKILINQLLRTSPTIAAKYSRSELRGGDVLLGIIRATKVALVPDELRGANITQGTARFRPSSRIRSKFLAFTLEAPSVQKWLHAHYRGIDMPGLNLADVRRVPIPIPSLSEQDEIIRRVEELFAFADRIESRLANIQKAVERLTPATLAKAFRGELVSQDPNDEPASKLLSKLQGSRHSAPKKKNSRP